MIKIDKEFKELIPALSVDEKTALEENIKKEGCRDALVLWGETLIDGHNRYEICTRLNIPYKTVTKDFESREDVIVWIIQNQFGRRNLSAYDRSVLALKMKSIFVDKAKENQGARTDILRDNICQISDRSEEIKKPIDTKKEIAKIAGVSHDTIARVEKIEKQATPEIKAQVKSGEISINQAYQATVREEKKAVVKEKEKAVEKVQHGGVDIFNTDRKYNIIYADPAWKYFDDGNKNQSLHYTTMTIEEICDLPVKNIADDNCILFLWVTSPILDRAFEVIRAWGFNYSTVGFVWVKKNKASDTNFFGCGSWTRANAEYCLIATKGQIDRMNADVSQIIEAPIGEHSAKPLEMYDKIERLVGKLSRIELFSRVDREGWDRWGNGI